jgi:hypothetical protein
MHLIHIADTHSGFAAFNRLNPETGMNLREKQVYNNFLSAIDVLISQKPDVLVRRAISSILSSPRPGLEQTSSKHSIGSTLL